MIRVLCALVLASATCAAPARAEIYEIPVPGLQGVYGPSSAVYERSATFHLPGLPSVVHGASLRVRGTAEVGTLRCGVPPQDIPWPTSAEGWLIESVSPLLFWHAYEFMPVEPGKFEWTAVYKTSPAFQATWAFLDDGEGLAYLFGGPAGHILGGCSESSPPPNVTVEQVGLLIDA